MLFVASKKTMQAVNKRSSVVCVEAKSMTKRVLSGVFILVALIALGVIIAGALNSGDQLLVRFLTAVVVAALGIYVISDLRLQTDDAMKATATSSNSFRDMTMAVSSNSPVAKPVTQMVPVSTAEFMDTVTSTSNQRVAFEDQKVAVGALATADGDGSPQDFYFSDSDFSEDPDGIFVDMEIDPGSDSLEEDAATSEVLVSDVSETIPSIFQEEDMLLDSDLDEKAEITDDVSLPTLIDSVSDDEGHSWPDEDAESEASTEVAEGQDLTNEAIVVEDIFKSDKDLFASLEAELEHLEPIMQEQLAGDSEVKVVSLLDAEGNVKSLGRLEPKETEEELAKPTVSEALAPIIDLREGQSVEVASTIDAAIKTGELEVISTLIEQGMLSTEGEISDRDVRTMVYVAFTSNELRKVIKAGGNPDEPNPDIDLGPVELFDETVHTPAPKTMYKGRPKAVKEQAVIDVRSSADAVDKESV